MVYQLTYKEFYEGLKGGKLLGLKCKTCGAYTVPPKINCIECHGTDLAVTELSRRGEIRTFTVIRVAPEGFAAPYAVALVELDEGPWVMGNIEGIEPDCLTADIIGRRITVGHRVIPAAGYSAGEGVGITFLLE